MHPKSDDLKDTWHDNHHRKCEYLIDDSDILHLILKRRRSYVTACLKYCLPCWFFHFYLNSVSPTWILAWWKDIKLWPNIENSQKLFEDLILLVLIQTDWRNANTLCKFNFNFIGWKLPQGVSFLLRLCPRNLPNCPLHFLQSQCLIPQLQIFLLLAHYFHLVLVGHEGSATRNLKSQLLLSRHGNNPKQKLIDNFQTKGLVKKYKAI